MSKDHGAGQVMLLYSVDAFVAGLLFALAILLALVDQPSVLLGALTDLSVHLSWDNRAFGFPVAATMLMIAIWQSWRIYRSKVITIPMQFALGFLACALIGFKIFLFLLALDKAMHKVW